MNRLREARVVKRVTQFQLRIATGIQPSKISLIENGLVQPRLDEAKETFEGSRCKAGRVVSRGPMNGSEESPKRLLSVHEVASKRLYSVKEAAFYLGLSPRTLYNGISKKSKHPFPIKPKNYGKRRLFERADLDDSRIRY